MIRREPAVSPRVRPFALLALVALSSSSRAQAPPDPPIFLDPRFDGEIVAASDVHMETAPMSDPDPGDVHFCTNWEIWSIVPAEIAWSRLCVSSPAERTHIHLGDGQFQNSHAVRTELLADTDYRLRVSFQDHTGLWSRWSQRLFTTGPASEIFPMELDDVAAFPAPRWEDEAAVELELPGGPDGGSLALESAMGDLLLGFRGRSAPGNVTKNPPGLVDHDPVRVRIRLDSVTKQSRPISGPRGRGTVGSAGSSWETRAGSAALLLPRSTLTFTEDSGDELKIYLPPVNLDPGEEASFWISTNGSSYWSDPSQAEPDFALLARGAPVPWSPLQPGYQVEVVATGFELPIFIAFVPDPGEAASDPYFYVTELYGTIKVVTRDGTVNDYATDLLNFDPTGLLPGSGEKGLGGIAVDPATGDLLLGLLYDDGVPPNGPHYPRVIRLTSLDGGRTAASQTTILEMPGEEMHQSHFISDLSLGPDGKLYVHLGDGTITSTALDLNSFRGKILRVNLDGTAPSDNPFYDARNGISATDYIFAYGFRNPFGGVWRAADGAHYEVENGLSTNDRLARVDAGVSYGWSGSEADMEIHAIHNWAIPHAPVEIAYIESETFSGSGFPREKHDHAFVTESGPTYATGPQSNGKRIVEFVVDPDGTLVSGPTPFVEYNGSGKASAGGLAAGPDGLYFTDLYKDTGATGPFDRGASVLRVRFVGTADFVADVTSGAVPVSVQFTDTSNVPNPTSWTWFFGDGATSNLQNPQHQYTVVGSHDVRLEVSSATGLVAEQKNGYILAGDDTSIWDDPPVPFSLELRCAPNPFESSTLIRYDLVRSSRVHLRVFDVSGRLVRVLVDSIQEPGSHEASWTGRDRRGHDAAAGVYFFHLDAGDFDSTQRVVRSR